MPNRADRTTTMARLNHIGAIWYSGPRNGAIARCKIARQLRPAATVVQAQNIQFSISVIGGIVVVHGYVATTAFLQQTDVRSEEHTSELQSRGHLVCRLLL